MSFAGGMVIATSVPALAITAAESEPRASVYVPAEDSITIDPQRLEVASEAEMKPLAVEGYAVEGPPPPVVAEVAGLSSASVAETGQLVWPVLTPERQSDVFGPREAPCSGCSTVHDGVDFLPGDGTPVSAIADGVVITSTDDGGGLGVWIEVEHNIGGEIITSFYAHMAYGSRLVSVGDRVSAGQQIGSVGSSGQSTGPHLHLEMYGADGVRFDPYAWLKERIG